MALIAKTSTPHESKAAEYTAGIASLGLLNGSTSKAVRELLNGSLAAAQNVASWLEQSQRLNVQAVNTCHENLNAAMREAEQADDMQKLMRVTTHLATRQMGAAVEQFGAGIKQMLESNAHWVERMRSTTVGLSQGMMQNSAAASSSEGGGTSALAQLGHAQAEWLAMTQRWIDSVKSVQGRS